MNILGIILSNKNFWDLESKTLFHHAVSQYLTQLVSFNQSRVIRGKLYKMLGNPYSQDIFNNSPDKIFKDIGLNDNQIPKLRQISSMVINNDNDDNNLIRLSQLSGIGPWTIKSIKLMKRCQGWHNIILEEDSYIRNRIAELCNVKSITPGLTRQCIINTFPAEYYGIVSLFFWRVTSVGISNMLKGNRLTKDDFQPLYHSAE